MSTFVATSNNPSRSAPKITVDFFNEENPRSLINIVPDKIREAMLHPNFPRVWFDLPEGRLRQRCEAFLESKDHKLRILFWDEYSLAQDENRKMMMERVTVGACNPNYFYKFVLTDPHKLVWILNPPADYQVTLRELLVGATNKIRDIIALPILDEKGKANVPLIREMIKVYAMLENRIQGPVKQIVDVNQKSLSVSMRGEMPGDPATEQRMDELEDEIRRLNEELAGNLGGLQAQVIPKMREAVGKIHMKEIDVSPAPATLLSEVVELDD